VFWGQVPGDTQGQALLVQGRSDLVIDLIILSFGRRSMSFLKFFLRLSVPSKEAL